MSALEFDAASERVVYLSDEHRTQKEINAINRAIRRQRQSIDAHISELELMGGGFDVEQIISRYRIQNDDLSLLGYIDKLVKEKNDMGRTGTAIAYHSTRSSLSKFIATRHLSISNIDAMLVKNYEHFLVQTGVKANTICYYLRNFKSIYARAISDGFEQPALSPFRAVTSKPQKTVKRALSRDNIARINNIKLTEYTHTLSRDIFMFSFLTRGMPFVDIFHLTKKSINENIITYYRKKTGQQLQVALTDETKEIIKRYASNEEYIFPMGNKADHHQEIRKMYNKALEKTNRYLKRIGKSLNIETPLTTYLARHT